MSNLPKSTMVTFQLHSKGTGVCQEIQMEGSSHLINVDAAPVFGGNDQYPSPMAYALGALISCSQVTAQLVAKDFDIELRSFEFDLAADLDTAILCDGAMEGNPNFQTVDVNAVIETDAPDDVFKKFYEETERRCPLYQLFQKSGSDIKYNWLKRANT
jgi:uncharacterized OsmC-like protein